MFDVFSPDADDIAQTHDRWLEREPGIFERAVWDESARTLTLTVRGEERETTMALAWLSPDEWRSLLEQAGFEIEACYGWFDRSPYRGGEDTRSWRSSPPRRRELVERDRAGSRDVQGLGAGRERDRRALLAAQRARSSGRPSRSAPRTNVVGPERSSSSSRRAAVRNERDPTPGRVVEGDERHAEERAHRRAQRLRARRVGASLRDSRDERRTERVGRTHERAHVPRIADVPERKTDLRHGRAR